MRAGAERHRRCRPALSGQVSVGLAPGTAAQLLAIPLLTEVQRQHPGIVLYFNENFGTTLSELIMSGRMDMAVIYGDRDIHGLRFLPLMKEELFFVCPHALGEPRREISPAEVARYDLFLPRIYNIMRKAADDAFTLAGLSYRVKCEIESLTTLNAALAADLGGTIMPESAARTMLQPANALDGENCRTQCTHLALVLYVRSSAAFAARGGGEGILLS